MKVYLLPSEHTMSSTALEDLYKAGLIPRSVGAFADESHWIAMTGVGAPKLNNGTAKFWRDNESLWSEKSVYSYLRTYGFLDMTMPDAYSHETFRYLSPSVAQFYRTYASVNHFPTIPKLTQLDLGRADVQMISFDAGATVTFPYPITLPFPTNMAVRFNAGGKPEAFFIEDYVREHPLDWTPRDKNATPLSDPELVAAVSSIIAASLSMQQKATAIRSIVRR